MSSRHQQIGVPELALVPVASINTGGTQAITEVSGPWIDTYGANATRYRRIKVNIGGRAVNTSTRMWKVLANLQDASGATGAGAADFGSTQANFKWNTAGTIDRVFTWEEDMTSAKRYVRLQFTPRAVTNTGGNTTATGGVLSYYGEIFLLDPNRLPAAT